MVKIGEFVKNRCDFVLRWPILSRTEKPQKVGFWEFSGSPESAKIALFSEN